MQGNNKIHMMEHETSGAKVPMRLHKIKDGTVDKYQEVTDNRKAFTLKMIQDRWNMSSTDIADLLLRFKIPGHINHETLKNTSNAKSPLDVAIFFEEYIYALESKLGIPHNKLKSRLF